MRQYHVLSGAVAVCAALAMAACAEGGARAEGASEPWEGYSEGELEWVAPRWAEIVAAEEPEGGVLFVGDSITQGADLASLFPGVVTSNHGIAADRTEGVLARMDMITRGSPERIVLMIGTNDLHQDGADTEAVGRRVGEILDAFAEREPEARLHVVGVLPRARNMADTVARANRVIREEAVARGVAYLDLTAVMADATGKIRDGYTYDDLHLNADGYAAWADAIRACVEGDCAPTYWGRVDAVGRTAERNGALVLGWPGSGLRFRALGDVEVEIRDGGDNLFDLVVEGEREVVELSPGVTTVRIKGREGPFRAALLRRSESFETGLSDVLSVRGEVEPDPGPARRILFIGDSITAGFGVVGADATCSYAPQNSSAADAYAMRVAERLKADAQLVAISGRGAAVNYADTPLPDMLAHFELALPDGEIAWDHAAWEPDAVVVALGTNDFSQRDPQPAFTDSYAALLLRVAEEYPEAKLFAVTGPMLTDGRGEAMAAGVDAAVERAGVAVEVIPTAFAREGHVYGCGYHPGPATAEAMADAVATRIAAATGWE